MTYGLRGLGVLYGDKPKGKVLIKNAPKHAGDGKRKPQPKPEDGPAGEVAAQSRQQKPDADDHRAWTRYIKALQGLATGIKTGAFPWDAPLPTEPLNLQRPAWEEKVQRALAQVTEARKWAQDRIASRGGAQPQPTPDDTAPPPDNTAPPPDDSAPPPPTTPAPGMPYVDASGRLVWPGGGAPAFDPNQANQYQQAPSTAVDPSMPYVDPDTGRLVTPVAASAGGFGNVPPWMIAVGIGVAIWLSSKKKGGGGRSIDVADPPSRY